MVCRFLQLLLPGQREAPLIPDTISALEYEPVQLTLPGADEHILPDFVDVPHDLKVNEGDKAVLKVRVIGQPVPQVTWFVDDEPVEPSEKLSVLSDGDKHELVIHKAELDDEGMYKCVAKSEAGKAICEVELLVEGKFSVNVLVNLAFWVLKEKRTGFLEWGS